MGQVWRYHPEQPPRVFEDSEIPEGWNLENYKLWKVSGDGKWSKVKGAEDEKQGKGADETNGGSGGEEGEADANDEKGKGEGRERVLAAQRKGGRPRKQ